jgi:hypothetical protein
MLHRSVRTAIFTLAAAAGCAAGAAPIATDSQDANPAASTGPMGQNGEAATTISSGSSSIDRLMKLQDVESNQGSGNERSPPRKTLVEGPLPTKLAAAEAAASAANPLATLQAAILGEQSGAAAAQNSQPRPESSGGREAERPMISAGLRQPEMQAQNNSQERQSSGLVLTVARFVRENRLLVIGASLAVLAMVWGAATFASQRRR